MLSVERILTFLFATHTNILTSHKSTEPSSSTSTLMGRGAIPSRRGFSRGAMRHPGVSGITRPFGRLSRGRGQVLHVLLSRSPLASLRRGVPFDLHVLGAPPAFVLSQDQTL